MVLYACELCHGIVAVCDEDWSVFENPHDKTKIKPTDIDIGGGALYPCPHCHRSARFNFARDTELLSFGMKPDEYR